MLSLGESMEHKRSCPQVTPASDDSCTCAFEEREWLNKVFNKLLALGMIAQNVNYDLLFTTETIGKELALTIYARPKMTLADFTAQYSVTLKREDQLDIA